MVFMLDGLRRNDGFQGGWFEGWSFVASEKDV
jgi:hypothetical protein